MEELFEFLLEMVFDVAIGMIKNSWSTRKIQTQEQISIASPIRERKYKRRRNKHHL